MNAEDASKQMMMFCAICGEPADATALLTVRAPSGRTAMFAGHGSCVVDVLHPNARALLDAAPAVPDLG